MRTLVFFAFLLASNIALSGALERLFAPKAALWPFWADHAPESFLTVDHTDWSRFLQTYVERGGAGINRVAYASVTLSDREMLANYIARLERIPVRSYSRPEQLAYWINLYNATTLNTVLQHYPVESIQDIDISPGLFSSGPWGRKFLSIEGQSVSLNDIEHHILRPIWKDPRLHYVLNCASIGCPNLHNEAYTSNNLSVLLDQAARTYVNHPRGVRIENNELHVSSIYSWFQKDFGEDEAAVIEHLRGYADDELATALDNINRIAGDDYDWGLNDAGQSHK